ncbi:dephospho-CoA kinase [Gaoshiqia sediminis]|uniref:Dephospho-CoA kinase n=1 Tax=Gaoshiqia sediminis TaxID=2986998 RepID=A0AA41YC74_9BACT|nr:dephospho-CoA kinase [Gaoshiqia sediminis]MCW0482262.1 dephospho-CoA kinase [Gaoshiqia sediminis]
MMLKIGITGGIGSGKSTICHFFRLLGAPIFEADLEAKKIMNQSPVIRSNMQMLFGKDIYLANQTIDRKKLAGLIFNSPPLLEKVNSIIHPEVRKYFFEWCEKQKAPYIVHEAAILFESGFYRMMDQTILVTAPLEERIKRVMARENTNEEDIRNRISKQWPDEEKMKLATYILNNNNEELILPQLIELDIKFKTHG